MDSNGFWLDDTYIIYYMKYFNVALEGNSERCTAKHVLN